VNCSSCVDRRNHSSRAITTYWTSHDHALHLYSGVLHMLPLVSGIHSLVKSPTTWTSLHQFLNPDLKHSSTEGPISISNHSVTLTAPARSDRTDFMIACVALFICVHCVQQVGNRPWTSVSVGRFDHTNIGTSAMHPNRSYSTANGHSCIKFNLQLWL